MWECWMKLERSRRLGGPVIVALITSWVLVLPIPCNWACYCVVKCDVGLMVEGDSFSVLFILDFHCLFVRANFKFQFMSYFISLRLMAHSWKARHRWVIQFAEYENIGSYAQIGNVWICEVLLDWYVWWIKCLRCNLGGHLIIILCSNKLCCLRVKLFPDGCCAAQFFFKSIWLPK